MRLRHFILFPVLLLVFAGINRPVMKHADLIQGAWTLKTKNLTQVVLMVDGYFTHSIYNVPEKKFIQTRGGAYRTSPGKLVVLYEFDAQDSEQVGRDREYVLAVQGSQLKSDISGKQETWARLDDGTTGLSGSWKITARQQDGKLVPIHQTGTRKTVKILTGTRFQWAAIDPGKKQFSGTGGGTYMFKNGTYTEEIEFFSRDSSRVGQSLSFDGKLDGRDWHHSGKSSRGEPIYEVWSR